MNPCTKFGKIKTKLLGGWLLSEPLPRRHFHISGKKVKFGITLTEVIMLFKSKDNYTLKVHVCILCIE